MAVVKKIRSPQMIGLEWPRPGIGVFQSTLPPVSGSQAVGGFWPSATPDALGPRKDGQLNLSVACRVLFGEPPGVGSSADAAEEISSGHAGAWELIAKPARHSSAIEMIGGALVVAGVYVLVTSNARNVEQAQASASSVDST